MHRSRDYRQLLDPSRPLETSISDAKSGKISVRELNIIFMQTDVNVDGFVGAHTTNTGGESFWLLQTESQMPFSLVIHTVMIFFLLLGYLDTSFEAGASQPMGQHTTDSGMSWYVFCQILSYLLLMRIRMTPTPAMLTNMMKSQCLFQKSSSCLQTLSLTKEFCKGASFSTV